MKVAVCFSGLPRFIQQCAPYWRKSLLEPYDCDVFVHTWCQDAVQDAVTQQIVSHMYQPVRFQMQPMPVFDVSMYTDRIWPHRITPQAQLSQFAGIKRAQLLRQTQERAQGFLYDVVIRARFDWFLAQVVLEINPCVNVARTPTLDGHTFTHDEIPLVGVNDQFAYGTSAIMDVYSTVVDNIPHLYANHGVDFCGELFLRAHLHEHRVCIKLHRWHNGIVRAWGIMP
jgi:hypothetical protein